MKNKSMERAHSWLNQYMDKQIKLISELDEGVIYEVIKCITSHLHSQIFIIGNGGSAANASHFCEDLGKGALDAMVNVGVSNSEDNRSIWQFKVLSLTDNAPYITAIANDCGYDKIFSRQLENMAKNGDILIGISVSGTSPNLVEAFKYAQKKNMQCISITAKQGVGKGIHRLADKKIVVPDTHYGRVEDAQMMILHMICYYFIDFLSGAEEMKL